MANNILDRYAEPFRIGVGARAITIANNLILAPKVAYRVAGPGSFALFDYNVFGAEATLPASVADKSVGPEVWMKAMPHTRLVPGAGFADGDLGKITGFTAVDAGHPVEGVPYRGKAPDIGVAEK